MRERKIGTVTLGIVLVLFGFLFLVHTFWQGLRYTMIMKFWPLILISLGVETLWSIRKDTEQVKWVYDKGAVALLFVLSFFAMGMACGQFLLEAGAIHFQI